MPKYDYKFMLKYKFTSGTPFKERYVILDNNFNEKYVFRKYYSDEEDIYFVRKVKSLLNKLTYDNFDRMFDTITEMNPVKKTVLDKILREIFNKAIFEPKYAEIYSKLCNRISEKIIEVKKSNEEFREILFSICNEFFFLHLNDNDMAIKKIDKLGAIQFIGELYNINILKINLIIHYINEYNIKILSDNSPVLIEILCKFIQIIGKSVQNKSQDVIEDIFTFLGKISTDNMEKRYKFMILDLIDLKKNKWNVRKPNIVQPQKIIVNYGDE